MTEAKKKTRGEVRWKGRRYSCRHVVALVGRRKSTADIPLAWSTLAVGADEATHRKRYERLANERSELLGEYTAALRAKGYPRRVIVDILKRLAEPAPSDGEALNRAVEVARAATGTRARFVASKQAKLAPSTTLGEYLDAFVAGDVYRFAPLPKRLRSKPSTLAKTGRMFDRHVRPSLGHLPLSAFDHGRGVDLVDDWYVDLTANPKLSELSCFTYRARLLGALSLLYRPLNVLSRAAYPSDDRRLFERPRSRKYEPLRPGDDAALMACREVPLAWRMYWGTLAREGARGYEWLVLGWRQLNLVDGVVRLAPDATKTDRLTDSWSLEPGVASAFALYRDHIAERDASGQLASANVFALDKRATAEVFRAHLRLALERAGRLEAREILFAPLDGDRQATRHHLRTLFVMSSLCAGRSKSWIRERTGHTNDATVDKYVAKVGSWESFGRLAPLDDAIPELAELKAATTAAKTTPTGRTLRGLRRRARR